MQTRLHKFSRIALLLSVLLLASVLIPSVSATSHTITTEVYDNSASYSNQRKLARTNDGTLHAVYNKVNGSYYQIFYAYSADNGTTWTEEQVSLPPTDADQLEPSIAVDSKGNVHVVWYGEGWPEYSYRYNIQYRMRTPSGEWQAQENVTNKDSHQYESLCIAVDSQDNLHVVWSGQGWGENPGVDNVQYRMRTPSGEWQAQENVTDIDNSQYSPSMAVDSQDNIHVVWRGGGWGTGFYNVQYRMRNSTGWQARENITDKDSNQYEPSIAVDSQDNVHLVWFGYGWGANTGTTNVQYRVRISSGWQARENVTDKNYPQNEPTIALDSKDNIHVVWSAMGADNFYNIQYRMRNSTGWHDQVGLTELQYNQRYPNLIWAEWPDPPLVRTDVPETGFAFIYSSKVSGDPYDGQYNVTYYASEDLTWGVKTPEAEPKLYEPAVGGTILPVRLLESVTLWIILGVVALTVTVVTMTRRRTLI